MIVDGGPAFPQGQGVDDCWISEGGMTLRAYFATRVDVMPYLIYPKLLAGLGRAPTVREMADHIAFVRITEADALIRRLNEQDNL